jgi:hypothetical protein
MQGDTLTKLAVFRAWGKPNFEIQPGIQNRFSWQADLIVSNAANISNKITSRDVDGFMCVIFREENENTRKTGEMICGFIIDYAESGFIPLELD